VVLASIFALMPPLAASIVRVRFVALLSPALDAVLYHFATATATMEDTTGEFPKPLGCRRRLLVVIDGCPGSVDQFARYTSAWHRHRDPLTTWLVHALLLGAINLPLAVNGERAEDAAWGYPEVLPEATKVKGHFCFYDNKAELEVDGERQG